MKLFGFCFKKLAFQLTEEVISPKVLKIFGQARRVKKEDLTQGEWKLCSQPCRMYYILDMIEKYD